MATLYPNISFEAMIVDNTSMQLVRRPSFLVFSLPLVFDPNHSQMWPPSLIFCPAAQQVSKPHQFDVLVTPNLYGNIGALGALDNCTPMLLLPRESHALFSLPSQSETLAPALSEAPPLCPASTLATTLPSLSPYVQSPFPSHHTSLAWRGVVICPAPNLHVA